MTEGAELLLERVRARIVADDLLRAKKDAADAAWKANPQRRIWCGDETHPQSCRCRSPVSGKQ